MDEQQKMLMAALSAVVHYQEYIDTGEQLDLFSADAALNNDALKEWVSTNEVLLPVRRDNKKIRLGEQ